MKKKCALITGASRGIGREIARLLAQDGYRIIINYHTNKQSAQTLAEELNKITNAIAVQANVGDENEVSKLFFAANDAFGGVDVLVNNAGISHTDVVNHITCAELTRLFSVNTFSMFYCVKQALPYMLHQQAGKIINLSSVWGITGASCEAAYSASKAAVIGFTKALAKELGPSGIRVNCVAPGVIDTDMNRGLSETDFAALKEETPLGAIGRPEDVAQAVRYLASPAADFMTGQVISPNGGFLI